mgnify:CR=1 FL=1
MNILPNSSSGVERSSVINPLETRIFSLTPIIPSENISDIAPRSRELEMEMAEYWTCWVFLRALSHEIKVKDLVMIEVFDKVDKRLCHVRSDLWQQGHSWHASFRKSALDRQKVHKNEHSLNQSSQKFRWTWHGEDCVLLDCVLIVFDARRFRLRYYALCLVYCSCRRARRRDLSLTVSSDSLNQQGSQRHCSIRLVNLVKE